MMGLLPVLLIFDSALNKKLASVGREWVFPVFYYDRKLVHTCGLFLNKLS